MSKKTKCNKLKLLYITREGFPTFRVDIKNLFGKYLHQQNISTSIVAYNNQETREKWDSGVIYTYSARIGTLPGKITDFFWCIYYAWKVSSKYDAVQVRDKAFITLFLIPLMMLRKKPIFFWMSFPFPETDISNSAKTDNIKKKYFFRLRGKLMIFVQYRLVFRAVDHIFVQSSAMQQYLVEKYGIPMEKMTAVPMGIDMEAVENFSKNNYQPPLKKEDFVIVNLGSFASLREPEFILDIIKQLSESYAHVRLIIIGGSLDKKEAQKLIRKIESRKLTDIVRVTGWLEQEEAWKVACNAHLGISLLPKTLLFDLSTPTKTLEYAALGLPCIATNLPDQLEILDKCKCGICVPYDKDKILCAIIELLNQPEKRSAFAQNGKTRIGKFRGYDIISKQLAETYQNLLQHSRCRRR